MSDRKFSSLPVESLDKAIAAIREAQGRAPAIKMVTIGGNSTDPNAPIAHPSFDPRLMAMNSIYLLAVKSFESAQCIQLAATETTVKARKVLDEIKVRIELMERELGVYREDE